MEKCKMCGEYIDWNNPNIHYGSGHRCRGTIATNAPYHTSNNTVVEQKPKSKLSWKDVFDSYKVYPMGFDAVVEFVSRHTRYQYIAFNGQVYHISDRNMHKIICSEDNLL